MNRFIKQWLSVKRFLLTLQLYLHRSHGKVCTQEITCRINIISSGWYVEILFGEKNGEHWRTKTRYCYCRECGNNLVPGDENEINNWYYLYACASWREYENSSPAHCNDYHFEEQYNTTRKAIQAGSTHCGTYIPLCGSKKRPGFKLNVYVYFFAWGVRTEICVREAHFARGTPGNCLVPIRSRGLLLYHRANDWPCCKYNSRHK